MHPLNYHSNAAIATFWHLVCLGSTLFDQIYYSDKILILQIELKLRQQRHSVLFMLARLLLTLEVLIFPLITSVFGLIV